MKQTELTTLDTVTEGYLDYLLQVRRLSERSIIDMRCTYRQVTIQTRQFRPDLEIWRLGFDDYLTWIRKLRDEATSSVASISKQISHLRGLIDYAWRSGRVDRNPLDGFKVKDLGLTTRKPPPVLTVDEARRLIEACPRKTTQQKRERLMILLIYGCGLRTGELCQLDAQDIDIERQEILIKKAKGDIQRKIPVPDRVWTELLAFIAERGSKRGPLIRTEIKRTRIRPHDVLIAVHTASKYAGFEETLMPKTLRHSFATHLMDAGVDLSVISSLMGHRSPNESGVYLHALPGTRENAVARLSTNESEVEE